jgi:hypothetical protein
MSVKPSRVSIIHPPPEKGIFKIEAREDGIVIATPMKEGKPSASPSHIYDPHTKVWHPLTEQDLEDLRKLLHDKLSHHESLLENVQKQVPRTTCYDPDRDRDLFSVFSDMSHLT